MFKSDFKAFFLQDSNKYDNKHTSDLQLFFIEVCMGFILWHDFYGHLMLNWAGGGKVKTNVFLFFSPPVAGANGEPWGGINIWGFQA